MFFSLLLAGARVRGLMGQATSFWSQEKRPEFKEVDIEIKLSYSNSLFIGLTLGTSGFIIGHMPKERHWVTPKIQGFVSSSECAVRLATACTVKVRHTSFNIKLSREQTVSERLCFIFPGVSGPLPLTHWGLPLCRLPGQVSHLVTFLLHLLIYPWEDLSQL